MQTRVYILGAEGCTIRFAMHVSRLAVCQSHTVPGKGFYVLDFSHGNDIQPAIRELLVRRLTAFDVAM
jgi:hypothetical protein